ncbi:alpha/beta hydrolase [Nocardia mangyaensis]|uniref:alpha/beta hydrolase n=1 Tax=Nocardia mangyaensis TaxID=2213200 RepID=UPI00267660B7|nr:alpha/beta hydrolase [Nocardia mangyaensis]MDO3650678.1 alpha/beta hydrolase [Nocardia mangyaensis]
MTVTQPRPRASMRLRVADRLLKLVARNVLDFGVRVNQRGVITDDRCLRILGGADPWAVILRPPRGTRTRGVDFSEFRAEWVWSRDTRGPDDNPPGAILYFHGGAFVTGGLNTHRRIVARLSEHTGLPVLNVDYRQIPDAHIVQTVNDCVTAYQYLLDRAIPADRLVIAGDSAGGGLVFSTALAARDRQLPVPAALVAIAPWADYDSTERARHPNDATDSALSAAILATPTRWGMLVDGHLDPRWSPVNHDFTGLPPTLIQVGSREVLLADAEQLAHRCAAAGVPLHLQVWDNAIHVFHAGADLIPDAREAFTEIGAFVRSTLDQPDSTTQESLVSE